MARYIDADKLIAHLKDEINGCEKPFGSRANGKSIAYGTALGLKSAISFAETLDTADVAPRSEVAREIFEEIEKLLSSNKSGSFIDATCEWFDYFDDHLAYDIAELKKKYTDINQRKEDEGNEN